MWGFLLAKAMYDRPASCDHVYGKSERRYRTVDYVHAEDHAAFHPVKALMDERKCERCGKMDIDIIKNSKTIMKKEFIDYNKVEK